MIGSSPYNGRRYEMLKKIHRAGYRGKVSATAYYAADIYTMDESGWNYDGRFNYHDRNWMSLNLMELYTKYVKNRSEDET